MAKKFKVKTYEKDVDDHYVVVINPWANGPRNPRTQVEIDWIGAWLRIAFRKPDEKGIVQAIFSLDKRDEVIVQLNPCVDVGIGLGAHSWGSFIKLEELEKIERNHRIKLHDRTSFIFMYNWARNGDPAGHQWKENNPRQDPIPDFIPVKRNYPDPFWSPVPPADARLQSLLLPLPRPTIMPTPESASMPTSNPPVPKLSSETPSRDDIAGESALGQNHVEQQGSSAAEFTPYQPPVHFSRESELSSDHAGQVNVKTEDRIPSKLDKFDPYEEDEAALSALKDWTVKREELRNDTPEELFSVKKEAEDRKPDISDAPYEPSSGLVEAITGLNDALTEVEEKKSVVKAEDYQPSLALVDAISRYSSQSKASEDPPDRDSMKRSLQGHRSLAQPPKRIKREPK